jgi:Sec-independent protein translocase protein TatA
MLNLDPSKLLVIAVVIIIVLGPDRLPHVARQIGGAWRTLSEFRQRMESEVRGSFPDLPSTTEIANYARSPSAFLNRLAASTPVDDGAASDLGAKADLPPIGRGDTNHWTTTSQQAPTGSHDSSHPTGGSGADAEGACIAPRTRLVDDATLN